LAFGAAVSPGWWRLISGAVLVLVALCFYPVVRFGPETVRWRNWFRFKEIPTASIQRLGIENYNYKAWVPVVSADLDGKRAGRGSARFVATFSYRGTTADRIASEVQAWASEHTIPADEVEAESMTWRMTDPRRGPVPPAG
jgi:hypothetical protein